LAEPPQKQDDLFLAKAMDFNNNETDMADKAVGKASRPEVKKLAQEMADEHKKLNKELLSLAKDRKIAVATGVSRDHRETMLKMLVLQGNDFDRAFLNHASQTHQDAIKLFETEGAKSSDVSIRTFAERTLPGLRKHLEQVKALNSTK